jgi:pimeloyl-ACP methyl ester carboxylesterase
MQKVTVNGISLAYERRGTGAPLLLVHGFPLDHTEWEPLLPHLEDDFDIILPDLRGFGQSDAPDGAYTVEQMAADLAALLDELKIQRTYIVGHSMGGYVALAFIRSYPERVLGLGMVGSQAAADSPENKAKRYATVSEVAVNGVSAVAGMSEKLSANPTHVGFFREMILRQRPSGVIGALKAMAERPDSNELFRPLNSQ